MTEDDNDKTISHTVLSPGTEVSHYRIVRKIGAGGMGEVYLAEDSRLGRQVALKFLPAHMAADKDIRARFRREAQAAARLHHPHIVTIYDVSEHNDRPFIAMRYVEGRTLRHYCNEEPLPIPKIIGLTVQIAEGLAHAHAEGIVHRDIKSANIMVDSEFRPVILDFGLAAVQGGEMLTQAGSTLGTAPYMSPEQAQGIEADHRSDLFSLGAVLYELICGRTPFQRDNIPATLHAITSDEPEPLARYKADVPSELQRIVSKCLSKQPEERYQSAADLIADLRQAGRKSAGAGSASQPSIAVLPFTNMSADPENEYFADGLTEELLNVLARNPELKVTGRTSSFAFKGKQEDLREIGKKLGVGTLLEGSVRKAGNRLRITAQLVNTDDGFHLWSETYDRVLEDIFAVQDDIAQAVAAAMNVTLLGKSASVQTSVPESYALVLRANQWANQMSKSGLAAAAELYDKAIALDQNNAPAWAGKARAHLNQSFYGHADVAAAIRQAKESAHQALELDSELAEAYTILGMINIAIEYQFEEAGIAFRLARALAPNNSRILTGVAIYEGVMGNFDEAIDLAKRATELDPLDPEAFLHRGRISYWATHLDEAASSIQHALELSPGITSAHLILSWIYQSQGKLDEALSMAQKEESAGYRDCGIAIAHHLLGNTEEADRALEILLTAGNEWAYQFAAVYSTRKENDKAFEWLNRSVELHDAGVPLTAVHPLLANLHSDPRWPLFLEKIGLSR